MVTVTLDEMAVNAVTAALDERISGMRRQLRRLRHVRAELRVSPLTHAAALRDNEFALEVTEDAIRDAVRAALTIAQAIPEPLDLPDIPLALMSESEWRLMDGNR